MYLCDFQQRRQDRLLHGFGCELLSKFVSLWSPTTLCALKSSTASLWITFKICIFVIFNNFIFLLLKTWMLWITFKICIFVTSNNRAVRRVCYKWVVNYFQNLYLCDWEQPIVSIAGVMYCCELLSKFVSLVIPNNRTTP